MKDTISTLDPHSDSEDVPSEVVWTSFVASTGVKTFAFFDGQCSPAFEELVLLWNHGHASTKEFILQACKVAQSESLKIPEWYSCRSGLDVEKWLNATNKPPSKEYLNSAPVSYPLIFMTQIAKYIEALSCLKMDQCTAFSSGWLSGLTGHSQGLVAAVAVAMSDSNLSIVENSLSLLGYMVWHGYRSQSTLNFEIKQDKDQSPMLFVQGLSRELLEKAIQKTKISLKTLFSLQKRVGILSENSDDVHEMHVALINGHDDFVVSGHPKGLLSLRDVIEKLSAKSGISQARIPFSKRKPVTNVGFLDTTVPFHCAMNEEAADLISSDLERLGLFISSSSLLVPVLSTFDGSDMSQIPDDVNIMEVIVLAQSILENNLVKAITPICNSGCSHLLEFGPGKAIERKIKRLLQGTGIGIVLVDVLPYSGDITGPVSSCLSDIIARDSFECPSNWGEKFKPGLLKREVDGKCFLDTKYSRLIGKPPVLMPGMTPTTSFHGIDLVAACTNAGFSGELAAGGLSRPEIFKAKIDELVSKINPGCGICINMLYLNSRQWNFQFPLVLEMARNNYPIESITIGAGVPSPEKAEEIVNGLSQVGIRYIGLKPGSIEAIRDVIHLAKLHPQMNFMLQWTSGRGGGHHSFEDFHDPLLQTYAEMRSHENISLVVGSGFGDAAGSFKYLDGSWSTMSPYNRLSRMPVDGVLFGSRCMVAMEAATAIEVKQLIVDTPGLDQEAEWEKSYDGSAGGVITVSSELGEPIHKLLTRGMGLWKKYDEKYFKLPRGPGRDKAILKDKTTIISELNSDFQKIYFGCDAKSDPVDVESMTYAQVVWRMVELMHVKDGRDPNHPSFRWIHPSFCSRTLKMLIRLEARFAENRESLLVHRHSAMDILEQNPYDFVKQVVDRYPSCSTTLLTDDDAGFFIELCRSGGKPVNFIPVIDGELGVWMKKDSLWYSEELDAVPNRDPGRVCVLHGPVAARFSTNVEEPIASILGNIHNGYIGMMQGEPNKVVSMVTEVEQQNRDWRDVSLTCSKLVIGKKWASNPIAQMLATKSYVVKRDVNKLLVLDSNGTLCATVSIDSNSIHFQVFDINDVTLSLRFVFMPSYPHSPLHQLDDLTGSIKQMYRKVWDCNESVLIGDVFSDSVLVTKNDILKFNSSINYNSDKAPIDIATMAGWRPLVRPLFAEELEGNLLKLVHLSHGYKLICKDRNMVTAGERIDSQARVTSVKILPGVGKRVSVGGTLSRYHSDGSRYDWLAISTAFLIRGDFVDYVSTFTSSEEEFEVICSDSIITGVLNSQEWLDLTQPLAINDTVFIKVRVEEKYSDSKYISKIRVHGTVWLKTLDPKSNDHQNIPLSRGGVVKIENIGIVDFISQESFKENPVVKYLKSICSASENGVVFENGGYEMLPKPILLSAPTESLSYSEASRDFNPIHRNAAMASIAELPHGSTIVHGMWSAATARKAVEDAAGGQEKISSYHVDFVGMVFPGDELCITMKHVGMSGGRKVVQVYVQQLGSKLVVVKARAEIEQPLTSYFFTGQGSAVVNMGMDRYDENPKVRSVWDVADKYLKQSYGFSIIQIVRENPTSLTIHFGGPQGKRIRENFLKLKTEDPVTNQLRPLISEIDFNTKSFTFNSPQGLLFATQFSQPALVLVQKAAFQELIDGGFVPDDGVFAGHSLGEYAALASYADVMTVEALVETVFLRGMVMQTAVPRDQFGLSNYAMVAANPSRVSPSFAPETLEVLVNAIGDLPASPLIQIVNWNVRGSQYVVAGELVALEALGTSMDMIHGGKDIAGIVIEAFKQAENNRDRCKKDGIQYMLSRSVATIPLPGIDVPFHSRHLLPGVPAFRQLLEPRLSLEKISAITGRLIGKYIPNVIAEPFSTSVDYIERVQILTGSPALSSLIETYGTKSEAEIVRILVIELLAYQFAMPVQWIKTQDVIFAKRAQRIIEMGPAATLCTMASRTLSSGMYGDKEDYNPLVLWWKNGWEAVFYDLEDQGPSFSAYVDSISPTEEDNTSQQRENETLLPVKPPTPPLVQQVVSVVPVTGLTGGVSARHALCVLLSVHFSKSIQDISNNDTVKGLSGGKSAMQNEVIGDLCGEFEMEVDPESSVLDISNKMSSSYKSLGKVTTKAIGKMLAGVLPGGFSHSSVKTFLGKERGLSDGLVDAVLLQGLADKPKKRFGTEKEAKDWLDSCVSGYSSFSGILLQSPSTSSCVPMSTSAPAAQQVPDTPVDAKHVIMVILASKFGREFASIQETASIKELSNGKSATQNEIFGDLSTEFGNLPENGAEMTIVELSKSVTGYGGPGSVIKKATSKMMSGKMPGGFSMSQAKEYLSTVRHLGSNRIESVLAHGLTMQPHTRLADATGAKDWLDSLCDGYSSFVGISIPKGGAVGGAASFSMATVQSIPMEETEIYQKLKLLLESQKNLFDEFLGISSLESSERLERENESCYAVEEELYKLKQEMGDYFCETIQSQYDSHKVRFWDSYWNWVVQDAWSLHHHVYARVRNAEEGEENVFVPDANNLHYRAMAEWITSSNMTNAPPQAWFRNFLCNRATNELLEAVKFFSKTMHANGFHGYAQVITLLAEQVYLWLDRVPVYVALFQSFKPCVRISSTDGSIEYFEEPRAGAENATEYVEEISRGLYYSRSDPRNVADPMQSVTLLDDRPMHPDSVTARRPRSQSLIGREFVRHDSSVHDDGNLPIGDVLDAMRGSLSNRNRIPDDYQTIHVTTEMPLIHIKSPSIVDRTVRVLDEQKTSLYFSCLHDTAINGVSFSGQVALVTGAGNGSIGEQICRALLEGGATVICTLRIARSEEAMAKEYKRLRDMYEEYGSKGSRLFSIPSNCASALDTKHVVHHIYDTLNLDLDFVVPFAAAPEHGKDISSIDSASEVAHRMMLTNVIRLLGNIRTAKMVRNIDTRPAMVLIPCSPNHGIFGNDGLYAESKLGCESLLDKWSSEGWENYLCLAAAVIGWTRSALMSQNNVVAPGVEGLGCRTFSPAETMFNLMGLFHPQMVTLAAEQPLWVDLTGNWVAVNDMNIAVKKLRHELQDQSSLAKSVIRTKAEMSSKRTDAIKMKPIASPVNMCQNFPCLPSEKRMQELSPLMHNMVDLRQIVVVVGYGEVGPWGHAKTRWEMECFGEFSLEGTIELAWLVGLIKSHQGPLKSNPRVHHVGWVDSETEEPVQDFEIKRRYESLILKHCGIRVIEPSLFEGYSPDKKSVWHQVALDRDMNPIEVQSREEAIQYREEVGASFAEVFQEGDQWMLRLKKGAIVSIPKALKFDRRVAGQIPSGWDAKRMGVPDEIADSVDPVTLFTIVSTVEALVSAGLSDPYELYEYVHVSQVGNCSGGGMGGMRSLKRMFFDRKMESDIPSDTLAESFINTMPAWVNMLLLSSSGPIKTPVGACATAAESLDIAMETILSGKARVCIAGGYDDFGETGSYEFAQMGATANSDLETQKGRSCSEASRPMTESRAGFVEAQGAGMQILMDAELAIEMGVPIYGIVALTNTATDKQGRSVPAPGRGILTTARENETAKDSPLLDISYRRQCLEDDMEFIEQWKRKKETTSIDLELLEELVDKKKRAVWKTWGQEFYKGTKLSPLRGALSVWNLTIDDLAVGSFHGTSTKLNDKNESAVVNKQLSHLGRTKGNVMLVVSQKYLTGHPKGAACAWMVNGLLQIMSSKKVPGNRNLDNVSPELRENNFLFYPNKTVTLQRCESVFLKSFGFGQAGAEVVMVHPDYVLATLDKSVYEKYIEKRQKREHATYRYYQGVFSGKHKLVQVKDSPPYSPHQEEQVYLNPDARASFDSEQNTWMFRDHGLSRKDSFNKSPTPTGNSSPPKMLPIPPRTRLEVTIEETAAGLRETFAGKGIGMDIEPVSTFANFHERMDFIDRNFTAAEQTYCIASSNPAASFAGKWAAKEAIVKAISSAGSDTRSMWKGPEGALIDFEILHSLSGAPMVNLTGHASQVCDALGLSEIKITISHSGDIAVAQALAL